MPSELDLDSIKESVNAAVDSASSIATVIAPGFLPYIVMGTAIAKAFPELYEQVRNLLEAKDPTDEDKAKLARTIQQLANPDTL